MSAQQPRSAIELHGFAEGRLSVLGAFREHFVRIKTDADNRFAWIDEQILEAGRQRDEARERLITVEASTRLLAGKSRK